MPAPRIRAFSPASADMGRWHASPSPLCVAVLAWRVSAAPPLCRSVGVSRMQSTARTQGRRAGTAGSLLHTHTASARAVSVAHLGGKV